MCAHLYHYKIILTQNNGDCLRHQRTACGMKTAKRLVEKLIAPSLKQSVTRSEIR